MNVLSALMMVGLVGLLVMGGIQYVPTEATERTRVATAAEAGFSQLEAAYRARAATGAGTPAAATWKTELFPTYGDMPAAVGGLGWSYSASGDEVWFCLSGTASASWTRAALSGLSARMPSGLYVVAGACGGGTGTATTVAATLWISRPAAS